LKGLTWFVGREPPRTPTSIISPIRIKRNILGADVPLPGAGLVTKLSFGSWLRRTDRPDSREPLIALNANTIPLMSTASGRGEVKIAQLCACWLPVIDVTHRSIEEPAAVSISTSSPAEVHSLLMTDLAWRGPLLLASKSAPGRAPRARIPSKHGARRSMTGSGPLLASGAGARTVACIFRAQAAAGAQGGPLVSGIRTLPRRPLGKPADGRQRGATCSLVAGP